MIEGLATLAEYRDPETGGPLILYYDTPAAGPDSKAMLQWYRKQLAKLGIELVIRATDYNRFQDKMLKGTAQIFQWGWNADYPDPENFLFLLYGPNAKVGRNGENAANYKNPEYDALFEQVKNMDNGPERQEPALTVAFPQKTGRYLKQCRGTFKTGHYQADLCQG